MFVTLPLSRRRRLATLLALVVTCLACAPAIAEQDKPISFVNDIMPILTKSGCNMGVCHAKAGGGQNGFQLSLLGFEEADDFESIVKEGRGRRLSNSAPEQSLLLQKATGTLPHGGGTRIAKETPEFATLLRWIQEGATYRPANDPDCLVVAVQPPHGKVEQGADLLLSVIASFSDGTTRVVT